MSKQTSGREARVGILPDTPRQRNVKMFDGFSKSPLWANLYRQELAKESGKPIIQMLMDENYREEPDAKLKPIAVPGQEYDAKHGTTILKSIVEGFDYRFDDGSNTKDLIKELKLLPRSTKEANVRVNHFGKDFIRANMTKLKQEQHSPTSSSPPRPAHSLHLSTTHTFNSPQKQLHASPASPSQLDPFLSLIPPNRHSQARDAAQIFNNSVQRTSLFRARHPPNDAAARSPQPALSSPAAAAPLVSNSRPATSACGSLEDIDESPAARAERKLAEDKRTELLFKKLTHENPGILEKIKRMYIARNFSKQGASGYQPRKENYMQMSNNDAIEMLRAKIAQKLHSGPGELRRSFELFDRDGSGKVDIAELSEVLSMFNINLPPDQIFSLMCQFGASDGELDFNSFIGNVLAPVKYLEVQKIGSKAKKLKGMQFLVGKNWINMHNDQVITYLRQRIYQQYGFRGITFTLNALFRHFAGNKPLMFPPELHEAFRCFGMDVPLEQCADLIRDFMRDVQDCSSGGLDHHSFVRYILELDNPDEFTHIGAGSMLSRGLRLTYNDDEKHAARLEQLKELRERKNADAAGDIAVLVRACRGDKSMVGKLERAMRMKDVGRSGTINLRHFIDITTEVLGDAVSVTNARRVANIFDENMVGYVSYELLLAKINQQLVLSLDATAPVGDSLRSNSRVDETCAEQLAEKRLAELSDGIRRRIISKIKSGGSEFKKAFELLDRDGSGCVAFDELSLVLKRILGMEVPHAVVLKLFDRIDTNRNSKISFAEFARFFDPDSRGYNSPAPPRTPSIVAIRPFEVPNVTKAVERRPTTSYNQADSPFSQRKAELDARASLRTPLSRARTPLV